MLYSEKHWPAFDKIFYLNIGDATETLNCSLKEVTVQYEACTPICCAMDCIGLCHIDGLVQDCSNPIANVLGLLQACTKHQYFILVYVLVIEAMV